MRQIKFLGDLRHKLCAVHMRLDEGSEARALLDGAIKTIDNEIGETNIRFKNQEITRKAIESCQNVTDNDNLLLNISTIDRMKLAILMVSCRGLENALTDKSILPKIIDSAKNVINKIDDTDDEPDLVEWKYKLLRIIKGKKIKDTHQELKNEIKLVLNHYKYNPSSDTEQHDNNRHKEMNDD